MSNSPDATITATPAQELAVLMAKVTALSRQALDLTAPDELEALFPPGPGNTQTWYVVCVGRQPGCMLVCIPHQEHRKDGQVEALAYYRTMYENNMVHKMVEVSLADAAATEPTTTASG
ncbi:hypothetical protein FB451DRAFT_1192963 [Mycena latifolia]|nr:hypothetical protein FB451DRAFT_1192963 [Mycena latifolia]